MSLSQSQSPLRSAVNNTTPSASLVETTIKPRKRLSWSELCPINSFLCPISGRLLQDPVITADGHSYEKAAIENWFKTGSKSSPMTGSVLPHTSTIKNHGLKAAINEYMSKLKHQKLTTLDNSNQSINDCLNKNEKKIEQLESECSYLQKEIINAEQEKLKLSDDLKFLEKKFMAKAAQSSKKNKGRRHNGGSSISSEVDGLPAWLQRIALVGSSLDIPMESQNNVHNNSGDSGGGGVGSVSMGVFGALAAEELTMLCDEALRIAVNRKRHENNTKMVVIHDASSEVQQVINQDSLDEELVINFPWMEDGFDIDSSDFQDDFNISTTTIQMTPPLRRRYQINPKSKRHVHPTSLAAEEVEENTFYQEAIVDEEENQIEVLSEMFRCFDGKQWKEQKGWGEHPQHLGAWFGVCVEKRFKKQIVEIRLGFNNLTGKFPPIGLCKLVNLRVLDLQRNYINGPFPHTLPTSLVHLELKDNRLSGQIPSNLLSSFKSLVHISLAWNRLSGHLPEFGRLRSLHTLDLSGNMLHGRIPSSIAHLSACRNLWLHSNRFTGLIPTELADLRSLRTLSLSENQFIGNIPAELGTLIYLKKLLLAKNKLNGRIPYELGSLQNLEFLLLTGNKLTDPLTSSTRLQRHLPNCMIDI